LPLTEKKKPDPTLDTILNSIADGVFTIDLEKRITSFNRAAEQITSIHRGQALGQKCFDVFHANIWQGSCAMEKTMKTGKPIIALRINILNSEGKIVPVSVSTAVLKDKNAKTIGGVAAGCKAASRIKHGGIAAGPFKTIRINCY